MYALDLCDESIPIGSKIFIRVFFVVRNTVLELFTYPNADGVVRTLNIVASQLSLASYDVYTLFDSGATHSFISTKLALKIRSEKNQTPRILRTSLHSGKILLLEFFLKQILITINGVTLQADLMTIEVLDFDVILKMNFLGRNNAIIYCQHNSVTFKPSEGDKFTFKGRYLLNHDNINHASAEDVGKQLH